MDVAMNSVKHLAKTIISRDVFKKGSGLHHKQQAQVAGLRVIAVTGGNGTAQLCTQINDVLRADGLTTALFMTNHIELAGQQKHVKKDDSILRSRLRKSFFRNAKKHAVDWIILELPVTALRSKELADIPVELAVLTPIGLQNDDIGGVSVTIAADYAKLITTNNPKTVVLDADDEWFEYFGRKVKNKLITVGDAKATHQIKGLECVGSTVRFNVISA